MPERRTRRIPLDLDMPLVASAQVVAPADEDRGRRNLFQYASWQDEAWAFYNSLGEYNFAVSWLANTISRVRLIAAESVPGGDEPDPLPPDHPASQIVAGIGGTRAGQAALMKSWAVHLAVPGDCWTVVEDYEGRRKWCVYSAKTIRPPKKKGAAFQVQHEENRWRPLSAESTTIRIWNPDEEYRWRAFSFSKPALPILRAIDLYNRRIIATLVSRIAMNGFLIVPAEMTFQSRPEFKDAPDPFIAELVEHASFAIKNPGTASAAIPFPVKIPGQWAEGFRHLALDNGVDKELIVARDAELRRFATAAHMPAEVILGMGDTTHWNAWEISDDAIKTSVSPPVEVMCDAVTDGFLLAALKAAGEPLEGPNGGSIVCWYDPSEVTAKPDKTEAALALQERGELSPKAMRREVGVEEGDKPTKSELRDWALKKIIMAGGQQMSAAVKELTGLDLGPDQPELPFGDQPPGGDLTAGQTRTPPDTQGDQPDQNAPTIASTWVALNGHKQPVPAGR